MSRRERISRPARTKPWWRVLSGLLALQSVIPGSVSSLGCRSVAEPSAGSSDGARGNASTSHADAKKDADEALFGGDSAWQPPYLLYFNGFDRDAFGLTVGDRYVYWYAVGGRILRGLKDGSGAVEEFIACAGCNAYRFTADPAGRWLYFLARDTIMRVDAETRHVDRVSLEADHSTGGIFVDERYVYVSMPGCAAITRVDKRTLGKESMLRRSSAFPRVAGTTQLARVGSQLICASPTEILAIDAWGKEPRLLLDDVKSLWGLAGVGDRLFFLEANQSPNTIGELSLLHAPVRRVSELGASPHASHLLWADSVKRLVYGTGDGLRVFDPSAGRLDALIRVGYVRDLALDGESVYATIWGARPRRTGAEMQTVTAQWIVRVPLAELVAPSALQRDSSPPARASSAR